MRTPGQEIHSEPSTEYPEDRPGIIRSSATEHSEWRYEQASSVEEEARILNQNFAATYGVSSVNQALRVATSQCSEYETIYAILDLDGASRTLHHPHEWKEEPLADEDLSTADEVRDRFFEKYGTHYISHVKYGLRIAIQGKMRKSTKEQSRKLEVGFKTAVGALGASGGVSAEQEKKLTEEGIEIAVSTTSGGGTGGLATLNSLAAVDQFLRSLQTGEQEYAGCPTSLNLRAYRPTLKPGWRVRNALEETPWQQPKHEFGVPRGTIIPWCPPPQYLKQRLDDDGNPISTQISAPAGWAICDGTRGTPDLRNRFVLGLGQDEWTGEPTVGGSTEVTVETGPGPVGEKLPGGSGTKFHPSNYGHTHTVTLELPLPPFVGLLYIMRVDD